jgi:hypothetical protein
MFCAENIMLSIALVLTALSSAVVFRFTQVENPNRRFEQEETAKLPGYAQVCAGSRGGKHGSHASRRGGFFDRQESVILHRYIAICLCIFISGNPLTLWN